MRKILILTNNYAGLYSFRKEVVQALLDRGFDVFISAPFDERAQFFEDMGCMLIDTQFNRKGKNPLKDFLLILYYRRLLKRLRPDVVLSYTIKPNLYGGIACQLCKIPQIANITGLGTAVENPGWLQRLTMLLYKIGLRRTNTVFFQNRANMEFCDIHGMVRHSNKVLIPGSGVNIEYHTLQEYPAINEPVRFIFIGRLLREKGIEQFLAAAKNIKAQNPDTEFHILGHCEKNYAERIRQLQADNTVIYHGRKLDVRPYIKRSHCTVHPSFYPEGMSNVLLESCAAGRPVITTDRPGCGEIVDDGVNGFIVKQRDANDLIGKIEHFLALPYEQKRQMGLKARKKVEVEFDRQIVVKAYLEAITVLYSQKAQ